MPNPRKPRTFIPSKYSRYTVECEPAQQKFIARDHVQPLIHGLGTPLICGWPMLSSYLSSYHVTSLMWAASLKARLLPGRESGKQSHFGFQTVKSGRGGNGRGDDTNWLAIISTPIQI